MYEEQNNFEGLQEEKIPTMLNVLTILTFIGSGIALLFFPFYIPLLKFLVKMLSSTEDATGGVNNNTIAEMNGLLKNAIPIVILGSIAAICCIIGAVWMRKQKMKGYFLYVVAVSVQTILTFGLNWSTYSGAPLKILSSLFFPMLFIVLYTTQRKHLNK